MRFDRLWVILLLITVGALFTFSIYRFETLFALTVESVRLVLALPQIIWWLISVAILTLWGLGLMIELGEDLLSGPKRTSIHNLPLGHVRILRDSLYDAPLGRYFRDRVRQRLRNLAVDLISLKSGFPEDKARELLHQGTWTKDEVLKSYLGQEFEISLRGMKQRLSQWLRPAKARPFLIETKDALNRLNSYISSIEERGETDVTDSDA
jgi:hypothetical protein